jgi:hypothetical protein
VEQAASSEWAAEHSGNEFTLGSCVDEVLDGKVAVFVQASYLDEQLALN